MHKFGMHWAIMYREEICKVFENSMNFSFGWTSTDMILREEEKSISNRKIMLGFQDKHF